jgi:hypothetical protein
MDAYGAQILSQLHTLTRVIGGLETEVAAQRRETERARLESSDRLAAVREEISEVREITDRLDVDVRALRAAVGRCPMHDGSGGALVQIRAKRGWLKGAIGAIVTAVGGWWATHVRHSRGTV